MVWALILAAGESKRMGEPKMLLPFGKQTIIESVVGAAVESGTDGTLVVLGAYREEIEKQLTGHPVRTAFNPHFKEGMLSSVQTGFKAVPKGTDAVVVILGDQPKTSSTVIDLLIDALRSTGKGIILPVHEGKRGHPVLISTKYGDEIAALDPETGLRSLIHAHSGDTHEVEVPTPDILSDIDTREDYDKL